MSRNPLVYKLVSHSHCCSRSEIRSFDKGFFSEGKNEIAKKNPYTFIWKQTLNYPSFLLLINADSSLTPICLPSVWRPISNVPALQIDSLDNHGSFKTRGTHNAPFFWLSSFSLAWRWKGSNAGFSQIKMGSWHENDVRGRTGSHGMQHQQSGLG